MAVNANRYDTDLVIKVQAGAGAGADGNPVYKQRRYNRIKPEAADEAVYAVGKVLAGLQRYTLTEITRQDDLRLEEAL